MRAPVPPSAHPFKYRLAFVYDGKRVVGYDNDRGKGDHKHLGEIEMPYRFLDEAQLLAGFWMKLNYWLISGKMLRRQQNDNA